MLPRLVRAVLDSRAMEILAAVVMGSRSDWELMRHAAETLDTLGVPHDVRALSAHRTPEALTAFLRDAEDRGAQVFIAGAGGAAHLPGVVASQTLKPVLGVPMPSKLDGLDSLLSIVQMPAGIPVATFAIGKAGATNAALFAAQLVAPQHPEIAEAFAQHRRDQAAQVEAGSDPRRSPQG